MKKLLYILLLSNALLLSSEHNKVYTQNTCNRTYWDDRLNTYEERNECPRVLFSRWEVYDKEAKQHIAHIAYDPDDCSIQYLDVDEKYQKQGIGTELVHRAITDMRSNHRCQAIYLTSAPSAVKFWNKVGAKPKFVGEFTHVFPKPSNKQ